MSENDKVAGAVHAAATGQPSPDTIAEAAARAAGEKPPELVACPCGQVPTSLMIEVQQRAKYGRAVGLCCGTWGVEFFNGYSEDPEHTSAAAQEAWNKAPRA